MGKIARFRYRDPRGGLNRAVGSAAEEGLPVIPLSVGTQIIGDLHLDIADRDQLQNFSERLESMAGIPRLIILGDLFEYWVGPAQLSSADLALNALRRLHGTGTAIDVIPGNRDFLLAEGFEARTGASLFPNGFVGTLSLPGQASESVLFIHGDELCSLDLPYQRLKKLLRSQPIRLLSRAIPGFIALRLADRLRKASKQAIAYKPSSSMQQQASTCMKLAELYDSDTLVCGHSHRFRDEQLPGGPRWLVVDAFGDARDTLFVTPTGRIEPLDRLASA